MLVDGGKRVKRAADRADGAEGNFSE